MTTSPPLSIGLPVFNGENYLESALKSLLEQRFGDFRLNVLDNASSDRTREICAEFSRQDPRVHYLRHDENIGAVRNWYRAFDISDSEFFKWAAHDDLYHPDFLGRCLEGLKERPTASIVYSRFTVIDEKSEVVRNFDLDIDTGSPHAHVRLYNMIARDLLCAQSYGVMRASVLRQTRKYMGYFGWDRNWLAELALRGEVYEIPEYLFLHRLHREAWGAALIYGRSQAELNSYDPTINWSLETAGLSLSGLVRFKNFITAVAQVPLDSREKLMCYGQLARIAGESSVRRVQRIGQRVARLTRRERATPS